MLVCEGKCTEPDYFSFFNRLRFGEVRLFMVKGAGTPGPIVNQALELRKREYTDEDDRVWAVFDVDQHLDLKSALETARANNLPVALSSPCFELWLLIHFCDQRAHVERDVVQRLVRGHLRKFDKQLSEEHFCLLAPGFENAKARAEQQAAAAQRGQSRSEVQNPQTSVVRLVDEILDAMLRFRGRGVGQSLSLPNADDVVKALGTMLDVRRAQQRGARKT